MKLEVFTPAGTVLSTQVDEIMLQSSDGEIGILPGHAPYVGLLGTGLLAYRGDTSDRMVVSGGVCSFFDETLTVLADDVDQESTVNRETYSKGRADLLKVVQSEQTASLEWRTAQQKLARMEAVERLIGVQ